MWVILICKQCLDSAQKCRQTPAGQSIRHRIWQQHSCEFGGIAFLLMTDLAPCISQAFLALLQDLINKVFGVDLPISVKLSGFFVHITILCLAVLDIFRRQALAQLQSQPILVILPEIPNRHVLVDFSAHQSVQVGLDPSVIRISHVSIRYYNWRNCSVSLGPRLSTRH